MRLISLYQASLAILVAFSFIFLASVKISPVLFFDYFFLLVKILHWGFHSHVLHISINKKDHIYQFLLPVALCLSVDFLKRSKYCSIKGTEILC